MSVYSGFATRKQETTYNNFVFKLIQILADEILNRRKLGIIPDTLGLQDDQTFDKKTVKIYKALRLMEQAKHHEPKFSESFYDLAKYISDLRKSFIGGDTASRFSSLGEFMKSRQRENTGDLDTQSNFTGINNAYGSIFASNPTESSRKNVQLNPADKIISQSLKGKDKLISNSILQTKQNMIRHSKSKETMTTKTLGRTAINNLQENGQFSDLNSNKQFYVSNKSMHNQNPITNEVSNFNDEIKNRNVKKQQQNSSFQAEQRLGLPSQSPFYNNLPSMLKEAEEQEMEETPIQQRSPLKENVDQVRKLSESKVQLTNFEKKIDEKHEVDDVSFSPQNKSQLNQSFNKKSNKSSESLKNQNDRMQNDQSANQQNIQKLYISKSKIYGSKESNSENLSQMQKDKTLQKNDKNSKVVNQRNTGLKQQMSNQMDIHTQKLQDGQENPLQYNQKRALSNQSSRIVKPSNFIAQITEKSNQFFHQKNIEQNNNYSKLFAPLTNLENQLNLNNLGPKQIYQSNIQTIKKQGKKIEQKKKEQETAQYNRRSFQQSHYKNIFNTSHESMVFDKKEGESLQQQNSQRRLYVNKGRKSQVAYGTKKTKNLKKTQIIKVNDMDQVYQDTFVQIGHINQARILKQSKELQGEFENLFQQEQYPSSNFADQYLKFKNQIKQAQFI